MMRSMDAKVNLRQSLQWIAKQIFGEDEKSKAAPAPQSVEALAHVFQQFGGTVG